MSESISDQTSSIFVHLFPEELQRTLLASASSQLHEMGFSGEELKKLTRDGLALALDSIVTYCATHSSDPRAEATLQSALTTHDPPPSLSNELVTDLNSSQSQIWTESAGKHPLSTLRITFEAGKETDAILYHDTKVKPILGTRYCIAPRSRSIPPQPEEECDGPPWSHGEDF